MYFLTVWASDGSSLRREVDQATLRVGRSADNDLVLSDPCVSRVHFEIIRRGDGCTLADLGSKAGTLVNSAPVREPVRMRPGDSITVGRTTITFDSSSSPGTLSSGLYTPAFETTPGEPPPVTPSAESGAPADVARGILDLGRWPSLGRPIEEILEKVMDLAGETVPYDRGTVMILDEEGEPVPIVRRPPELELPSGYLTRAVTRQVLGKREAVLLSEASRREFPDLDPASVAGVRSALCVPFWSNQKIVGLIYLDSRNPRVRYDRRHLQELSYLAGIAGAKIENARLFRQMIQRHQKVKEIQEAARIQQVLLPGGAPAIPGYRLDGSTFPCEEIGGDFYDFVALPGGRWGIAVADVAGHGLPAAILMSRFQATLSVLWESKRPLDRMIARLNQLLCRRMPENRYLTLFCGILDPREHSLTYVNAGHPSAWLLAPGGSQTPLPLTGLFLGAFPQVAIRSAAVPVEPESILVCPSDGVTEARNAAGEMFGEERLIRAAHRHLAEPPADIIAHLTAEVDLHRAGEQQADDMTLVILSREKESG
jgi:phosphoserine phosphatase RsbU/P